ncbi:MAG: PAS domain S-box protein [Geobacteraceae bacterium]|nr:PAS domain S-box protein [Geobacteraceae bacterium]
MERHDNMSGDELRRGVGKQSVHGEEEDDWCKSLFNNTHTVMLLIDPDSGAIFDANPAACLFYGYSREQLTTLKLGDLNTLPEDRLKEKIREAREARSIKFNFRHRLANGSVRDVEVYTGSVSFRGRVLLHSIIHDVTDQNRIHERMVRQNAVLDGINRIFREALTCATDEKLGETFLAVAEEVTGSKFGFIAEIGPDGLLHGIALSNPGWVLCTMDDLTEQRRPPVDFPIHGLYGRVLKEGKGFFTNDPSSHPDSIGTPEGHPRLTAFLGIPLLHDGRTIGMIAVANREGGYRQSELEALESLMPAMVVAFQRREGENARQESELFYRQTLESIPGMVFTTRPDGYCDYQSQQWVDFTGVPMSEHVGDGWNKLLHPDDRPRAYAAWRAAVEGRAPYDLEYRVRRRDGEFEWFKVRGRPIRNAAGEIVRWFGTALNIDHLVKTQEALRITRDELEQRVAERTEELAKTVTVLQGEITEREMADEALRTSEQKFRTLFEESKDVIYIMSPDGGLTDVNPAGVELFGFSKEELLSLDIRDLYCEPADRERFRQALFADGYVRDFEVCMRRKGGELTHVLNTATVIRTEQGEIAGYRGIIHDITQRKRLELQLLQAQKMESIGMLAGGVAHDFNNLLTAISGYSQIIQDQFADRDETLAMCVEQVLAATGRAVELTRNLLAFSRKQVINPQPVDVNDIVITLSKLLARMIGEDIELGTTLAGRNLTVLADKGQIDQVLINLATNARDAMPNGGKLHIRTEQVVLDGEAAQQYDLARGGAHALISVTDSGQGMDRETMARIFEPFYTTKETGKGTGLGLAIIYGIVKQHNGSITVTSSPGDGTTFAIHLPLIEVAACAAEEREPAAPARGTETLLLAEDDPMVRKYMKQILEMAGYTVLLARNGEEAVEQYRDNRDRIALVVCDVVMPKKNGKEVYDEIRAMSPEARVLFVSGYNDEIIHTKGILLEEIEFLVKPVNRQQLLAKLREMLDA